MRSTLPATLGRTLWLLCLLAPGAAASEAAPPPALQDIDAYVESVREAFDALRMHDVVLGPASDGGYYLVGAAHKVPPIFEGMPWSTSAVWPQTVAQLAACGARWRELPLWHDVDDEAGLASLMTRLQNVQNVREPALQQLLLRLHQVLAAAS